MEARMLRIRLDGIKFSLYIFQFQLNHQLAIINLTQSTHGQSICPGLCLTLGQSWLRKRLNLIKTDMFPVIANSLLKNYTFVFRNQLYSQVSYGDIRNCSLISQYKLHLEAFQQRMRSTRTESWQREVRLKGQKDRSEKKVCFFFITFSLLKFLYFLLFLSCSFSFFFLCCILVA